MKLSRAMQGTMRSPIVEAYSWMARANADAGPIINLSQAAPADPPHPDLRSTLAEWAAGPDAHFYGPVLGNTDLRTEIANRWAKDYSGTIEPDQVAITAGCNQAFCAAMSAIAEAGDNVIMTAPFYFNHAMRLHYSGIQTRYADVDDKMLPQVEAIRGLIDDATRAIILVSPNNPTGAEYPADLLASIYQLAKDAGIALILDETYKDFRHADGPAHTLFAEPDWPDVLIHLYSFSKAYKLTGHRVGAMIAGAHVLLEVEKYLDTETICVNQLAQRAALFGLTHLDNDVAQQRQDMEIRKDAMASLVEQWPGWRLRSSGAYFAFIEHPFDASATDVAKALIEQAGILVLPGDMFAPGNGKWAKHSMRFAFANVDETTLKAASDRIVTFTRDQKSFIMR